MDADHIMPGYGSSPHARGTPSGCLFSNPINRFIPARAGNTHSSAGATPMPTVHPRACGEHTLTGSALVSKAGSSPRVRGTHLDRVRAGVEGRFIPARAGNTASSVFSTPVQAVHPRACGEHEFQESRTRPYIGSSPRVRGTPGWSGRSMSPRRFIPARAGNTRA